MNNSKNKIIVAGAISVLFSGFIFTSSVEAGVYYDPADKPSLSVPNAGAGHKTFYVRPDGSDTEAQCNGNTDASYASAIADGTVPQCAHKTIKFALQTVGKTNDVLAGDVVKIAAGTYYERGIAMSQAGTSNNRITIGPKGDGEVILDVSRQGLSWTQHADAVYVTDWPDVAYAARTVVVDEVPYYPVLEGYNQDNLAAGYFYYDAGTHKLYVQTLAGDSPANHTVLAMEDHRADATAGIFLNNAHYVTIYGLTIRGAAGHGISAKANGTRVEKNDVRLNQGGGIVPWSYGTTIGTDVVVTKNRAYNNFLHNWPRGRDEYNNGLWGKGIDMLALCPTTSVGCNAPIISGNIVYKNGGEGIGIGNGYGGIIEDNIVYNNWSVGIYTNQQNGVIVRRNLSYVDSIDQSDVTNNGLSGSNLDRSIRRLHQIGISTGDEQAVKMTDAQIYNNILVGNKDGIIHVADEPGTGLKNSIIANNTIILPENDVYGPSVAIPGSQHAHGIYYGVNSGNNSNSFVKNNIIVGRHPDTQLVGMGVLDLSGPIGITFSNNFYYHPTTNNQFYYLGTRYDFAGWQAATGQDVSGVYGNPQFTGAIGSTLASAYTLANSSPARGIAEVVANFADDFNGSIRIASWDAGAVEYADSPDLTPPVTIASPTGGTFASAQTIILTANESATIYYTTDGSVPTASSTQYSSPISISASAVLKYFAKDTAGNSEEVNTQTYTIINYNLADFLLLLADWLKPIVSPADVNNDGVVNSRDLGIMMSGWN